MDIGNTPLFTASYSVTLKRTCLPCTGSQETCYAVHRTDTGVQLWKHGPHMQRSQGLFLLTLAIGCFALGLSEKELRALLGEKTCSWRWMLVKPVTCVLEHTWENGSVHLWEELWCLVCLLHFFQTYRNVGEILIHHSRKLAARVTGGWHLLWTGCPLPPFLCHILSSTVFFFFLNSQPSVLSFSFPNYRPLDTSALSTSGRSPQKWDYPKYTKWYL